MVADMVRAGNPGRSVTSMEAPGFMFLEERLHDAPTVALIRSQAWSYVIFQAQKYSTSGQFDIFDRGGQGPYSDESRAARGSSDVPRVAAPAHR